MKNFFTIGQTVYLYYYGHRCCLPRPVDRLPGKDCLTPVTVGYIGRKYVLLSNGRKADMETLGLSADPSDGVLYFSVEHYDRECLRERLLDKVRHEINYGRSDKFSLETVEQVANLLGVQ